MYLLYILDTVPGYVSKSRFEESHKKQTKPATLFDMNIWMDPATTLWAVCFCKDFFFNWDSLHAKPNSHYEEGVTRKRSTKKDYSIQEICLERTYS